MPGADRYLRIDMYKTSKVGVVVPAYNEELHIGAVLEGMPEYIDAVYVIDDGSTDRTREIASLWVTPGSRVHLLSHVRNRGVGAAIASGYRQCLADDMDIAVVMAGDNQMDPDLLPEMIGPVVDGRADYSKGTRMLVRGHRNGMSSWRILGNLILRWLTVIATGNKGITDPQNGYTAISSEALGRLNLDALYPYYGYCNDLITQMTVLGVSIVEICTPQVMHEGQKSHIKYGSYVVHVSGLLARCFVFRIGVTLRRHLHGRPVDYEIVR